MAELRDLFNYSPRVIHPQMRMASQTRSWKEIIDNPTGQLYTFPLFTKGYCARLLELLEATGRFDVIGATYAVPEIRLTTVSKLLMEHYVNVYSRHVLPIIDEIYGLADHFDVVRVPFVNKYTMETVQKMDRHWDAHATLSLSVNLNDDYEGGGLYFHEYDYNAKVAGVGYGILFPSMLTHEHEALPITAGKRYAFTAWLSSTKADVQADEAWVVKTPDRTDI